VEELAEILAVDLDDVEGVPKLRPEWRLENQEQALLTICPGLIAIFRTDGDSIVNFSHLSVKKFLTSACLANSTEGVSHYYVDIKRAHTMLAQECLGVLLQLDDPVEENGIMVTARSPLTEYAAKYWVSHAQSGGVSLRLRKAMEYLFDPNKPHFAAWLKIYDIDTEPGPDSPLHYSHPTTNPLPPSTMLHCAGSKTSFNTWSTTIRKI
jgi:hypothetical protein